ncbi:hypothetical protein SteCoe_27803 [Stentor coeruleus]|uniref:Probable threonine--tRNA ligase, cytoplasmic n=1 Tax=Stentor coeruleus TaxID=5963 RepID=A0A1R2B9N0_9CILI|nr:hypothetical protein SteCoe_27803 [Stentor coeruleus]
MLIRRFSQKFFQDIINYRLNFLKSLPPNQSKPINPIDIYYKDQKFSGFSHTTSPIEIAKALKIPNVLAAKVTYQTPQEEKILSADEVLTENLDYLIYDLNRPLEANCSLAFVNFDEPLGKKIFWHSSAHILGYALEKLTSGLLTNGPALNLGFYYDININETTIKPEDLSRLLDISKGFVKENHAFNRFVLTKSQALELFIYNPHKLHFLKTKISDEGLTSVYQVGDFVDLCSGPHLISTGLVKGLKYTDFSASHWLGNMKIPLQRVYGVSFPSNGELKIYEEHIDQAAKRDHRKTGSHLFFCHPFAAGSAFFLPEGTRIYHKLIDFLRKEYIYRGFTEVVSPNLYNVDLWKKSGHYAKYKEDMYLLKSEEEELGLKPMNCPGHCLIFDHNLRSYKELPLRIAEFGVLHRNEISGSLSGLTRVRRFIQDDSHIFCRKDQIESEVFGCLDFVDYIYKVFDFSYTLELSTKPKNALGNADIWSNAEDQLMKALQKTGKPWKLCQGEGAFYGPKIDIKVEDAMGRSHQCGTIQLDFNLPKRFNLQYKTENTQYLSTDNLVEYDDFKEHELKQGFERPIIIHRAILGSLERFIGVLTEHYAGKWPFWISPRQGIILTVNDKVDDYAEKFRNRLVMEGYAVDIDMSSASLNKKIRTGQMANYNYMMIIGDKEKNCKTVDVRDRESNKSIGTFDIKEVLELFRSLQPVVSQAKENAQKNTWNDFLYVENTVKIRDLEDRLSGKKFLSGDKPGEEDFLIYKNMGHAPCGQHFPVTNGWYEIMREIQKNIN